MYSNGLSEVYLGKAIKELNLPREEIVVMTKVCGQVYLPIDAQAVLITSRRFGELLVKWVTQWCGRHRQLSLTARDL
jgi:aryl-alcohol dehydrogenase-like predicted oxidoreductase